ncbi:MAG: hypothetical protein K1Y02_18650 [Candidatus Hydrogenedentes bacterium]|nr:hypothetical protein [Candidatus Hydrogenedentota bacterium]
MTRSIPAMLSGMAAVTFVTFLSAAHAQLAEPWQTAYTGDDAAGNHVIAFWNFDESAETATDASGHEHFGSLDGVTRRTDGRFGGCIESFPGWPVEDVRHGMRVAHAPSLSPRGAFTIEMWVCPSPALETYDEAFIVDKKYVAHSDYQWVLERPDKSGHRGMRVCLGFGENSDTWYAPEKAAFKQDTWSHIAFTYDGAGTVRFFCDGRSLGESTRPGRGSIFPGDHFLSIGDRVGSYYHGFPGRIDEVRITEGAREFRPLNVFADHTRSAYVRMEPSPQLQFRLANMSRGSLSNVTATVQVPGVPDQTYSVPEIAAGASHAIEYAFDTRMRPDDYPVRVQCQIGEGTDAWVNAQSFIVNLVPRRLPYRMPVVMWGIGGIESVTQSTAALKEIGFTHCLGLGCDFQRIWDAGQPVPAVSEDDLARSRRMLDQALVDDIGVVISLGVGHWLENKPELLRVAQDGTPYKDVNACCNLPPIAEFGRNVGASVAQTYGAFPAFCAALINTEVRDGTQLCFHDADRALYRSATGKEFPSAAENKRGVTYSMIPDFAATRVVADGDDILQFYRWFWCSGDGWNGFHSAINDGLHSNGRSDFWTFFDPAVRVPPLWGSGGNVNYLSHWTYTYPDPIRIGLTTDELFAMAKGGPAGQDVMKMTQIIWYRSQTAPADTAPDGNSASSPWEDRDPGAQYITIAPMHLREALWTKIARPIKGIMYHGWESLVPNDGSASYRYTHPETRVALKTLLNDVIAPLGPTLLQVPAAPSDVAFLESFTSSVFAGRGTYGWGGSWAGDAYHVLLYAHLQPEIVYEETILKNGLDAYRVLVLADCDVLPQSIVDRIHVFKQNGGIVVGDERLCPAIQPDILLPAYERTKAANEDKEALLARARSLREQLDARYSRYGDSTIQDVLPYRRTYGTSDYVFAINDRREFGSYVGQHGLVMENGLPASSVVTVRRAGHVYDLVEHRNVPTPSEGGILQIPADLEPGGGKLWLITDRPIEQVQIHAPEEIHRGDPFVIEVLVTDSAGAPIDAVVPLKLTIRDPDGRLAEFSGYYGARDAKLTVQCAMAPNDVPGMWTIEVRELASGIVTRRYFRSIK